jgi:hypothetical protein
MRDYATHLIMIVLRCVSDAKLETSSCYKLDKVLTLALLHLYITTCFRIVPVHPLSDAG